MARLSHLHRATTYHRKPELVRLEWSHLDMECCEDRFSRKLLGLDGKYVVLGNCWVGKALENWREVVDPVFFRRFLLDDGALARVQHLPGQ